MSPKSASPAITPTCDLVAERVALGQPPAELAEHAASCERCAPLLALPRALAATGRAADPGIGFASRMTAGAQHRLGVRRRRRIAAMSAMSVAAAAVLVLLVTNQPDDATVAFTPPSLDAYKPKPAVTPPTAKQDPAKPHEVDPDVRALVHLANIDRELRLSANWGRIEKPLRPYRAVLEGRAP